MTKVILGIASDHAGFELKEKIKRKLNECNFEVYDFGTNSIESVNYPDFAHSLCKQINKQFDIAILICGSGNGMAMTANKYSNVRAALCWNQEIAKLARLHNDANILVLPARFIDFEEAWKCVEIFLNTAFEGGRHLERINRIPINM